MNQKHIIVLVACLTVFGHGCKPFEVPCRVISWGNMSVTREGARSRQNSNELFWNLDWLNGDAATPAVAVRMPDGEFIRTDEVRRDSFAKYLEAGTAQPLEGWDFIVRYSGAEARVLFEATGTLKRIQISVRKKGAGKPTDAPATRGSSRNCRSN